MCLVYCLYTISYIGPPGPPSTIRHSILSSSANEVSVSVQWDPPTETGGRDDLTYTVTISPPAQLFASVLTSTSVPVTAQYNVDYTVSSVATNCAGNSATAEYSFMIGKLAASFVQLTFSHAGGCPVLTDPMNGTFGPVSSRMPGSTVTIQCHVGNFSAISVVTCEGSTLIWSPDPEAIVCTIPTSTPTTREFIFLLIVYFNSLLHSPSGSNELHSFTTPTMEWHHQWSFSTSYSRYTSDLTV